MRRMLRKIDKYNDGIGIVTKVHYQTISTNQSLEGLSSSEVELITYVLAGKLTFEDNIGNEFNLGRGEVMHNSCGTNLEYSIHNFGEKEVEYIQLEVKPSHSKTNPSSEAHKYKWKLRLNHWLELVSSDLGEAQIRVDQDIKVEAIMLSGGEAEGYAIDSDRQALYIQLEGSSNINGKTIIERNGLEIEGEDIVVNATLDTHGLIIELEK